MNYKMNFSNTLDGLGKDIVNELLESVESLTSIFDDPKNHDSMCLEEAISQLTAVQESIKVAIPYFLSVKLKK